MTRLRPARLLHRSLRHVAVILGNIFPEHEAYIPRHPVAQGFIQVMRKRLTRFDNSPDLAVDGIVTNLLLIPERTGADQKVSCGRSLRQILGKGDICLYFLSRHHGRECGAVGLA